MTYGFGSRDDARGKNNDLGGADDADGGAVVEDAKAVLVMMLGVGGRSGEGGRQ